MKLTMADNLKVLGLIGVLLLIHSINAATTDIQDAAKTQATSAVTYDTTTASRLGDQILLYTRAKAFAHKYKLPLLYQPFTYSDQLVMHTQEKQFQQSDLAQFSRVANANTTKEKVTQDSNTLYLVTWCGNNFQAWYGTDWGKVKSGNKQLHQEIVQMIQPLTPTQEVFRPADQTSVAVHVRRGGGYDPTTFGDEIRTHLPYHSWFRAYFADKTFPLKFPPIQFYIDQLRSLSKMLGDKPLYAHIFTDHQNPQAIIDVFHKALGDLPITFGARLAGNAHNTNVLDDFFAMTQFDCLIRAQSYLSIAAQMVSKHRIVISPTHHHWENDALIIDKVLVEKS